MTEKAVFDTLSDTFVCTMCKRREPLVEEYHRFSFTKYKWTATGVCFSCAISRGDWGRYDE